MIQVTANAVQEVKRLLQKHSRTEPNIGLRLGVKGGGCSGLSYSVGFDTDRPGDTVYESDNLKVYVDPKSYLYLKGMTLDFNDGLEGRGFKFVNPNAQKSCGCGESFSV